jgi:hypothetical protein
LGVKVGEAVIESGSFCIPKSGSNRVEKIQTTLSKDIKLALLKQHSLKFYIPKKTRYQELKIILMT